MNLTPATNPTYFGQSQTGNPQPNGQPANPTVQGNMSLQPNANIGQRAFGPLLPLTPRYLPTDPEGTGPRQYQYPVGANILLTPRREYPELIPFEQLWNIATMYDVAAMCINTRVEETQGFEHSVVAKDKRKQRQYQSLCEEVNEFFLRPDGFTPFESWIGAIIREHLITDAITVFPHLDRGGQLYAAELVDGSTVKPLLDDRGRTLAYQQIVYGIPFSDYKRPYTDREDEQFPTYSTNELLYLPRFTSTKYPYGSPPSEGVILRVNQAIRKQISDLSYFSSGNIPDMLATLGDGQSYTPEQVEEFEVWFNSILEGNDAERRKLRFIPNTVDVKELRPFTYETTLDEWMLRITCAAFAVPPTELGFTDDANRASSETQAIVNERRGIRPMAQWLKRALLDELIHNWLGRSKNDAAISVPGKPTKKINAAYKEIAWAWKFGDKEDASTQSTTDRNYVEMGVLSKDEVRAMRFANEVEGPAPSDASAGASGDGSDTGGGGGAGPAGGEEAPTGPEAGGEEATPAEAPAEAPAEEEAGAATSAEEVTTPPAKGKGGEAAAPKAEKPAKSKKAKPKAAPAGKAPERIGQSQSARSSQGHYPIEMPAYPKGNGQLFQGKPHETSEFPIVIYPDITDRYPALARFQQDEMAKASKKKEADNGASSAEVNKGVFFNTPNPKPKKEKPKVKELDSYQRDWLENLIYVALNRVFDDYNRKLSHQMVHSKKEFAPIWNDLVYDLKHALDYEIKRTIRVSFLSLPPDLKLAVDDGALHDDMDVAVERFVAAEIEAHADDILDVLDDPIAFQSDVAKSIAGVMATFAGNLPVALAIDQANGMGGRIAKFNQDSLAAKLGFGKTLLFPPKHINCRCKIRPLRISPEQVQELARKTGYLNEDDDGNFYYAARSDFQKDLNLMPGHLNKPDEAQTAYERKIKADEDKATQARIDAEYTAQSARRKKWREDKQRQRASAQSQSQASADWRSAASSTTDDQEEQAELDAQAEKDWQRQDDKAMQARIAQARSDEDKRIKDKMDEWRQSREAQHARDVAERKAKVEAKAGVWIAIWHTDFSDACTQEMRTPWGDTVAGCRALKGICVTEGPYLGHMVGSSTLEY